MTVAYLPISFHSLARLVCLTSILIRTIASSSSSSLRGSITSHQRHPDDQDNQRALVDLSFIAEDVTNGSLGRCQGDCDGDENCSGDLVCFKRNGNTPVPGCGGDHSARPGTDYCIRKQDHPDFQTTLLGHCQGDCDADADCAGDLVCVERTPNQFMADCPNSVNDGSRTDYCVNPSFASSGGSSNTRSEVVANNGIDLGSANSRGNRPRVVSSATKWQYRGEFDVAKPTDMQIGDLLMLIINRSDDYLQVKMSGWNTVASCLKDDNADRTCAIHSECVDFDGDYCKTFRGGRNGHDLASVVFTRPVTQNDINNWVLQIRMRNKPNQNHPGWAMLAVIRDAHLSNPVRNFSTTSCDGVRQTIFPSVSGSQAGDLLLLSMAYDDKASQEQFQPPDGMEWAAYVYGEDETGVLYQQTLSSGGPTQPRRTRGDGWRGLCKDASISMVIRPKS